MDIRVIVPHMAMSAGTMIACSSREIIMGKESSLGPIDPQYHNVPAQGVLKEFERAMNKYGNYVYSTNILKFYKIFLNFIFS